MKFISLFAGIGGLDLGLESAGMTCVAQVEKDDYCRRVLAKHWPEVPKYEDVRDVGRHNLPECDLICGGFPCQDISYAGEGAGIDGERSGLWREFHRIICELRPRYVLVENVAALLTRGIDRVLGDLAASGYDADWDCLPAAAVGACHLRDRLFIVAHTHAIGRYGRAGMFRQAGRIESADGCCSHGRWAVEPAVGRVAYGVPDRVDRLKGLGNAVVPQVAEHLGNLITEHAGGAA